MAAEVNDETKHLAELLEMTGASEISDTARMQVAAMKIASRRDIAKLLEEIKDGEEEVGQAGAAQKHSLGGGIMAVAAANRIRNKQVRAAPPTAVMRPRRLHFDTVLYRLGIRSPAEHFMCARS